MKLIGELEQADAAVLIGAPVYNSRERAFEDAITKAKELAERLAA